MVEVKSDYTDYTSILPEPYAEACAVLVRTGNVPTFIDIVVALRPRCTSADDVDNLNRWIEHVITACSQFVEGNALLQLIYHRSPWPC